MKTICLLTRKGGSGKSTLAAHFAVEADNTRGSSAVLIDIDVQGSCSSWYQKREAATPLLLQSSISDLASKLAVCAAEGIAYSLIDTVPDINAVAVHAARVSDLVVIPVRPSVLDLEAISASVELAKGLGKPAVLVLNQTPPGTRKQEAAIAQEARVSLAGYKLPICPTAIVNRILFSRAMIDGRTAGEIDRKSKAATEIKQTWKWIRQQLNSTPA